MTAISYQLLDKDKRGTLPAGDLPFGALRTDHMFVADYKDGGWQNARIVPYGPFSIMPGAICLHYGETIFEGAKAYIHPDGELYGFRVDENAKRFNHSADMLMMARIPEELFMEGCLRLLDVDRAWCPQIPESSMYIRPFMFATQDSLGVKSSNTYTFCVMLSPSGPYYKGGFSKALRLLITNKYHRAVSGGTGSAKCGGNYAASLRAADHAAQKGCDQVLYLDAANRFIEEVGTMNHYHILADGTFVIPEFTDSLLRSITSLSVLELGRLGRIKSRTEHIAVDDFISKVRNGEIIEAGGFGTAAVVSPVGSYLLEDGSEVRVGDGGIGKHSKDLYAMYSAMQIGKAPAPEGWLQKVPHF